MPNSEPKKPDRPKTIAVDVKKKTDVALRKNRHLKLNVPQPNVRQEPSQILAPLETYRTEANQFCRKYEERIEHADGVEVRRGIACRAGKRDWPDVAGSTSLPESGRWSVFAMRNS